MFTLVQFPLVDGDGGAAVDVVDVVQHGGARRGQVARQRRPLAHAVDRLAANAIIINVFNRSF